MKGYEPILTFDESNAAVYDDLVDRGDEVETVEVLASLAGGAGSRALELAIGTGRIALPLAARGILVDGIDLSVPMVERLRAKPGGGELRVVIGDFVDDATWADLDSTAPYDLIFVVFNSFFNVLTQDGQVRGFEHAAAHLAPTGRFVVEGGSTLGFLDFVRKGQYVAAEGIEVDAVRFDLLRLDPATQLLEENHVRVGADGVTFNPVMQRYTWPSELDLMARIAGLRLHERWGGWHRQPFTAQSENVVSVYGF
jgi:SAM-dependent methyltransferase